MKRRVIFHSGLSSLLITARLLLFPRLPISALLGTEVAFVACFKADIIIIIIIIIILFWRS
jgi:hypothetical protein